MTTEERIQTVVPADSTENSRPQAHRRTRRSRVTSVAILLVAVIVCVLGGVAYSVVRAPKYEATNLVLVRPVDPSSVLASISVVTSSTEPARTVETAVGLLTTRTAAERTAGELNDGTSASKVSSSIAVVPRGQSYLISITAQGDSASSARRIVDVYTRSALALHDATVRAEARSEIATLRRAASGSSSSSGVQAQIAQFSVVASAGDSSLSFVGSASTPDAKVGLSRPVVLGLSAIIGLFVGALAIYAFGASRTRSEGR